MPSLPALAWRLLLVLALVTSPIAGLRAMAGNAPSRPGSVAAETMAMPCHMAMGGDHGGDRSKPLPHPPAGQCACDWSACCHGGALPAALAVGGPPWMPDTAAHRDRPRIPVAVAISPPTRPPIA